jgi:outer membrane lipoprotein SlyB
MSLLGSLRVRLSLESEAYQRGMANARKSTTSLSQQFTKFQRVAMLKVASVAAIGMAYRKVAEEAKLLDSAQGAMAAAAKLTGQSLGDLEALAASAERQFKLSKTAAAEYTLQISKLADRAGGLKEPAKVMEAFLDIGAARGLSAAQTLEQVDLAIRGGAKAVEELFNTRPSEIYDAFANSIGKVASQLTEQERATAIANAALRDGEKVRGSYAEWLSSAEGRQYQLSSGISSTSAVIGQALQPVIMAILPILSRLTEQIGKDLEAMARWGMHIRRVAAGIQILWGRLTRNSDLVARGTAAWEEQTEAINAHIKKMDELRTGTFKVPDALAGRGATDGPGNSAAAAGRTVAERFYSGLEEEWERLRHELALREIELTGSTTQQMALETEHAKNLLNIEEQHARARHAMKELTDAELAGTLQQLNIRREIVETRGRELTAIQESNQAQLNLYDRKNILLDDSIARENMMAKTVEERLSAINRIYELQKQAVMANMRLSEGERDNELLKLRLAREREEIQARMLDQLREETSLLADAASSIAGIVLPKGGGKTGAVGSVAGSMAGGLVGGTIGAALGSSIGSTIGAGLGKLFGKKNKDDEKEAADMGRGLTSIERAQRDTITAIQKQTDALLNPESRLFNLPSTFNMPSYMPALAAGPRGGSQSGGGGAVIDNSVTHLTVNVTTSASDPKEVARYVESYLADGFSSKRKNGPIRRTYQGVTQ